MGQEASNAERHAMAARPSPSGAVSARTSQRRGARESARLESKERTAVAPPAIAVTARAASEGLYFTTATHGTRIGIRDQLSWGKSRKGSAPIQASARLATKKLTSGRQPTIAVRVDIRKLVDLSRHRRLRACASVGRGGPVPAALNGGIGSRPV